MFGVKGRAAIASIAITCGLLASCGADTPNAGSSPSRLDLVRDRDKIVCGVSGQLPGFSFIDEAGNYSGLDVDICRAIAAAIFDDPEKVEYRNLNAKERFAALQSGEIDILSRNTTVTLNRDVSVGLEFGPVVFYDGQGIMVKSASNINSLDGLQDEAVCVQTGTTTEQNLTDRMAERGIDYTQVVFEDFNVALAAYTEGRCAGLTADRSQLISRRSTLPEPEEHQILDAVLSKEPLAPAVASGDLTWAETLRWTVFATIAAEELEIDSGNLDERLQSQNPEVARFLGQQGTLGSDLGLDPDFAVRIVRHVGNYSEIYQRNLGSATPLNLPRGQNALWSEGGLLYAPPFR
ncbi:MAG: amino acid ABC transporter substrate-binding protein [Cyanobacteria bacterium J06641_5]